MPRTRSRPKTEEKFQNAVLSLVARSGCGDLGINLVAQEAGADKVLIYRYFGDFQGLLQTVAKSRPWLPTSEEILEALPQGANDALTALRKIEDILLRHIREDACTHQLVRWRRAGICPLCDQFTEEWRNLWKTLPVLLAKEQHSLWNQACSLMALIIEAELCDEPVDRYCLDRITAGLAAVHIEESSNSAFVAEDTLPTNLL